MIHANYVTGLALIQTSVRYVAEQADATYVRCIIIAIQTIGDKFIIAQLVTVKGHVVVVKEMRVKPKSVLSVPE